MNTLDKFDLKEDIAVITGGAGLLGRYHAKALLDASCRVVITCLLYTSPSPRDRTRSRMPSSA